MERTASTKADVLQATIGILKHMTSDWDLDFSSEIGSQTQLISNLWFESIDMVQFVMVLEEHFQRRDLPFEKLLMADGRYVDDLRVEEVVDFLYEYLNT